MKNQKKLVLKKETLKIIIAGFKWTSKPPRPSAFVVKPRTFGECGISIIKEGI